MLWEELQFFQLCRACDKLKGHGCPLQTPQSLPVAKESPVSKAGGIPLEDLGMVPLPKRKNGEVIHWEKPILEAWNISESAALATLEEFASTGEPLGRPCDKNMVESLLYICCFVNPCCLLLCDCRLTQPLLCQRYSPEERLRLCANKELDTD